MTDTNFDRWRGQVESRLMRLDAALEDLEAAGGPFGVTRQPRSTDAEVEGYPDLDNWVRDYFCTTFTRPFGGEFRWCTQWRAHPEAVVRLDALWSSWKALRRDPVHGMSTWLHSNLDPQLAILLSARGPFGSCSITRHQVT